MLRARALWCHTERYLEHVTSNVGETGRASLPAKYRSFVWDRVLHVAPFGYTLLEIAPLSLSGGGPATRWLRGVRLDRQCATCLGELRADRGCLV